MATLAPSAARRLAIAAPMPREPPVMIAMFPSSFLVIVFFPISFNYVSMSIKLNAGQNVSSDLFTHRYEIKNCSDTARATARLRPGRGPRTRHARFLGQRLRRRDPLRSDSGHAHQSAKSLRRIWQQAAALSKGSRSIRQRTACLFWQGSGGAEGAGCYRTNILRCGRDGG